MEPQNLIDDLNRVLLTESFTYIETIGQGSFGIVVAAFSSSLDRIVAIKITQNFEQENESDLLQECSHPNIVKLYKVLIANNRVYLIMERLQGTTLDVLMKKQELEEKDIRNIMLQVLNALVFLHRKGIIHRDLKPDNIFICDNNYVKLIDLGLGYQIVYRGFIGNKVGTPYYIAPEIINQYEQTQLVDIFSLGIIFYQMINNNEHPLWQQGQTKKEYYQFLSEEFTIQFPQNMSDMAKDFVKNTVTFWSYNRMTAEQCLEHPWILGEQRKSHPITNREMILRFQITGKFCNIIKALMILKQIKERSQEEIFYMKTQESDEINERFEDDETQQPMSSRVHTEKFIHSGRTYRKERNTVKVERKPSIKFVKTSSHQDLSQLTILRNRVPLPLPTSRIRNKCSIDASNLLITPKPCSLKKIGSSQHLPIISPNKQKTLSFNFRQL